jgi:hypothetical protein
MATFAAVRNGTVQRVIEAQTQAQAQANCPADCTLYACPPSTAVGAQYPSFSQSVVASTAAELLDSMIDSINIECEARMMQLLTAGGAKKYEYSQKAREVRDYRAMSQTLVALLLSAANMPNTRQQFAWAMAEVDETGDSLEVVITRYETAVNATILTRKIAARAQKLKRQLRAATTTAARQTIFNARTWPTS